MSSTAPAFPNGTSAEIWEGKWCRHCVHDPNFDCPLLLEAYAGIAVEQWVDASEHMTAYLCTSFSPAGDDPGAESRKTLAQVLDVEITGVLP